MNGSTRLAAGVLLLCIILLTGCSARPSPSTTVPPPEATENPIPPGLTPDEFATLNSLQKADDYPLYTMTYFGAYRPAAADVSPETGDRQPPWGCSLFTVLPDGNHFLYGRNFDWEFSPAVLLFTDPPDGYASVSMVDIAYLGFEDASAYTVLDLPIEERTSLLDAPQWPFDGMNEHGLVIGMAAVPPGNMKADESKETIGSIGIIRRILDQARTVNEAVTILKTYNINFSGGPSIHYLIADANGRSVLVEFYGGEMYIFENEEPWQTATNFLRSSVDEASEAGCWRYNKIDAQLIETGGQIDAVAAMQLLAGVSQNNTQWSVVYQMSTGTIDVVMGRQYQDVHQFEFELSEQLP